MSDPSTFVSDPVVTCFCPGPTFVHPVVACFCPSTPCGDLFLARPSYLCPPRADLSILPLSTRGNDLFLARPDPTFVHPVVTCFCPGPTVSGPFRSTCSFRSASSVGVRLTSEKNPDRSNHFANVGDFL